MRRRKTEIDVIPFSHQQGVVALNMSAIAKRKFNPDPELEALRERALSANAVDGVEKTAHDLLRKTQNIHAAYLFSYPKTLQSLCLHLNETQHLNGWTPFGAELGIPSSYLGCLKYNNFNNEDPTYNILLIYVQNEEANIGKIVQALINIQRFDVLERVDSHLNDLADKVRSQHRIDADTSDYGSLQSGSDHSSSSIDSEESIDLLHNMLKPTKIPDAPFLFKNWKDGQSIDSNPWQCTRLQDNDSFRNINVERMLNVCKTNTNKNQFNRQKTSNNNNNINPKINYGKKIFLTFASDGEKIAKEIASVFRQHREHMPRIGVVMLSEQTHILNKNPHLFVSSAFLQCDYVCPILTTGYLDIITKRNVTEAMESSCVDHQYAQYLYDLMNKYYIENQCINDKVRCILPDHLIHILRCNLLLAGPLFSVWERSSNADELACKLLKSQY